jgi:lysophospholipase L1-like esterase
MSYVRFAALGDSTTAGIGDPVPGGWRGWARLLADAMAGSHDMSFCNLAVSGAVVGDVRHRQLPSALAHRPDIASLIVGVNDTMRSTWDRPRIRAELLESADALSAAGAILLTTRFHDHGRVFGLPGVLRRPLFRRIEFLNDVYREIRATYGGIQVDLAEHPQVWSREFWSVDRLHPSELGHRMLARVFAEHLHATGLAFEPPSTDRDGGYVPNWRSDLTWMVTQGAPWVGRRARDLGPWAARMAVSEACGVGGARRRTPAATARESGAAGARRAGRLTSIGSRA